MNTNKNSQKALASDYENANHIKKKKKAAEGQFHKKNVKEIIELLNEEDEEVAEMYARYIK